MLIEQILNGINYLKKIKGYGVKDLQLEMEQSTIVVTDQIMYIFAYVVIKINILKDSKMRDILSLSQNHIMETISCQ